MDAGRAYEAEFEALGEVEVNDRIERRYYEGASRAFAMRWLNDKAMARLTGASFLAAPVAAELALLARNSRRSARMAMAGALVAGALTVANFAYAAYAQMQLAAREAPHRKPAVAVVRPRAPLPDKVVAADSSAADSVAVAATTRDASQPPPQ